MSVLSTLVVELPKKREKKALSVDMPFLWRFLSLTEDGGSFSRD